MKKKFICSVCGYIYEGEAAPEKCPLCKAPASKFTELADDGEANFATMHVLGAARNEGANEEMIKDLEAHFNGECTEVGMYLAMSRQADRQKRIFPCLILHNSHKKNYFRCMPPVLLHQLCA